MHVCKYLNQRVGRIGKSFRGGGVSKRKKKKKHTKRLSFYYRLAVAEKCLEKCQLMEYLRKKSFCKELFSQKIIFGKSSVIDV